MATNLNHGSSDDVSVEQVRVVPKESAQVLALAVVLDVIKSRIGIFGIDNNETRYFREKPYGRAGDVECIHTSLNWLLKAARVTMITSAPYFDISNTVRRLHTRPCRVCVHSAKSSSPHTPYPSTLPW